MTGHAVAGPTQKKVTSLKNHSDIKSLSDRIEKLEKKNKKLKKRIKNIKFVYSDARIK